MVYEQLAKELVQLVGGEENIQAVVHCATRLRFKLNDPAKAKKDAIEELDDVIEVASGGGRFQIVIGGNVDGVYKKILKLIQISRSEGNLWNRIIDTATSIFVPFLGVLAGAGILKGILLICVSLHWISQSSGTYVIWYAASDSLFYFLPILIAITSARKFDANPFVAVSLAGAMLYPSITGAVQAGNDFTFLHIPVVFVNYSTSVVPILLSVWSMSVLEKFLNRHIPASVKNFMVPLLLLMVMVPSVLLLFGTIGNGIGKALTEGYLYIYHGSALLAGAMIGAFWQMFAIFGVHWEFVPVSLNNIAVFHRDTLTALIAPAVLAQAGAALGVFLKTEKAEVKAIAGPAALSGFFGITEPAVFGVTLRFKKPFVIGAAAGAIGGAITGVAGSAANTSMLPGLATLPAFYGKGFSGFLIGTLAAFILAMILTYFFGYKDASEEKLEEPAIIEGIQLGNPEEKPAPYEEREVIASPLKGETIPLEQVSDPAFASGMLGKGLCIKPSVGKLYAPISGTVTTVFPSGHAIGITSKGGAEILIHIGIDTVQLEGKYYHVHVKKGQTVEKGELLIEFEINKIREAGYDLTSPIVITNSDIYLDVLETDKKSVDVNDRLITIVV
ncbi:PTS beta-glucoside transporter subunit EIIBCA [Weizmannia acidilactici]|uniref:PTS beta-glucoside transporter subunit EIIBCA n=1 Tax=Weizmannia acidilactici TaxID=2607726 RepID=A0A5J4JHE9_9BACI|nr:beta-glucoside-specific PTS transporter subunit IIABC [Weizmannia acidilactici]GER65787.1 PTS beta-glucoside transporter subunit EIIBCA [Weizmannia acidilactici]GER71151.1 PTS beta-glucoside transporter subunit EIIBCA [Weizmannia acidilactici]GER74864.1 PTS beta-glucoside transporter subunit EIIBCA [Weizmannia acidilactici]